MEEDNTIDISDFPDHPGHISPGNGIGNQQDLILTDLIPELNPDHIPDLYFTGRFCHLAVDLHPSPAAGFIGQSPALYDPGYFKKFVQTQRILPPLLPL
jgi:hypothetical protein